MMKTKVLEHREHEVVKQIKSLLRNAPIVFNVDYFLGEDVDSGAKLLQFIVSRNDIGTMFSVYKPLETYQFPSDIEDQFMSETMNNLMLAGLTWFSMEKVRKNAEVDIQGKLRITPGQVIYLN